MDYGDEEEDEEDEEEDDGDDGDDNDDCDAKPCSDIPCSHVSSFHSLFLSPDCNCENDDDQLKLARIVCQGIRDLSGDNQT